MPVPAGILAAQLAGNQKLADQLLKLVVEFGNQSTNQTVLDQIADATLALEPSRLGHGVEEQILNLASKSLTHDDDSVRHVLIDAAAIFRQGLFQEAADLTKPLTHNPDDLIGARSGYFYARASHQQRSETQTTAALKEANIRLQAALSPGFLGHRGQKDKGYENRWVDFAGCLLLRDDMQRNVWEWCQDWRGTYPLGPATDPTGSDAATYRRMTRGGNWFQQVGCVDLLIADGSESRQVSTRHARWLPCGPWTSHPKETYETKRPNGAGLLRCVRRGRRQPAHQHRGCVWRGTGRDSGAQPEARRKGASHPRPRTDRY